MCCALAVCVLLACFACLRTFAVPAHAVEPEFDGNAGALTSDDWMTGISGDRLLSDVVLPGSSGSATTSLYVAGEQPVGLWDSSSVTAQNRMIDQQLLDGVRLFDFHLTAEKPGDGWVGSNDTLWVAEQSVVSGEKTLFFAQDSTGNAISFRRVVNYMRSFLKKHPFETVVIVLSEVNDATAVFKALRSELDRQQNYLYLGSTMPKMRDVRGKVVVCTTHPELLGQNGGLAFPAIGSSGQASIGGKSFSAVKVTNATTAQGLSFSDEVPLTGDVHANHSSVVFAGITSTNEGELSPRYHANSVNAVLFGNGGTFSTTGVLYGWVLAGFMDAANARQLWFANFPAGLAYSTVEFWTRQPFEQRTGSTNVLKGASVYGPECGVENPGKSFAGWTPESGGHSYRVGEAIPVTQENMRLWASWTMTWGSLSSWLAKQGGKTATITLEKNLAATSLDRALFVPAGANVTIDLAGKTLDRGLVKQGFADDAGSVIQLAQGSSLTIRDPGKLTGGYSLGPGGGVLMSADSTLVLDGVTITGNEASSGGAGVYAPTGATLKLRGNTHVEENGVRSAAGSDNVFLGDGVSMVVDAALSRDARIGVSTFRKPASGTQVVFTQGLPGRGGVRSFSSDDPGLLVGSTPAGEAKLAPGVTVSFDTQGGTYTPPQTIAEGMPAKQPTGSEEPAKYDKSRTFADYLNGEYVFGGWYSDQACTQPWDFSTPVTQSITLYAKWRARYTFSVNGGTGPVRVGSRDLPYNANEGVYYLDLDLGETVPQPTVFVSPSGKEFAGWTYKISRYDLTSTRLFDFNVPATTSIAFTAHWRQAPEQTHTVRLDTRGGSPEVITLTNVPHGSTIVEPSGQDAPELTGYELEGWYRSPYYTSGYEWDFGANTVTADLTLYAKWRPKTYTVSFRNKNEDSTTTEYEDYRQSVSYGSQATKPDPNPQRDGYRFAGWYYQKSQGAPLEFYIFAIPVREDLNLWATWTKLHTVTLDPNGGEIDGSADTVSYDVRDGRSLASEYEGMSVLPTPAKKGSLFEGWFYHSGNDQDPYGERFRVGDKIRSDVTVIAKWQLEPTPPSQDQPPTHKVTFETGLGVAVEVAPQYVINGELAIKPADPVRSDHFYFTGWYASGMTSAYDFNAPVMRVLVLEAQWSIEERSVSYVDEDNNLKFKENIGYGHVTSWPGEEPTKEGYVFKEWLLVKSGGQDVTPEPYDFSLPVTEDITLKQSWTKVHTVTFESGEGGSSVEPQSVADGQCAVRPGDPSKEGCAFRYWHLANDDAPFNFNTAIEGDLTLYAAWDSAPVYNVCFETGEGSAVEAQSIARGGLVKRPLDPSWNGHRFDGWYLEDAAYDFSTEVTSDLILTAHWSEEGGPTKHQVSFGTNGGTPDALEPQVVSDGGVAVQPDDPSYEGCDFAGWYELLPEGLVSEEALEQNTGLREFLWLDDGQYLVPYDFAAPVYASMVLRARWQPRSYTVSFQTRGGSEVMPVTVEHGASVEAVVDPVRDGYTFVRWSRDEAGEQPYDLEAPVTSDLVLYAQWAGNSSCHVHFDSNGGSAVADQEVAEWGHAAEPEEPTRQGHDFDGWWEVLPHDSITCEQAEEYAESDPDLAERLRFDDENDGAILLRYEFANPVTSDLELRAQWMPITLSVTYLSGDEVVEEQSVPWGGLATKPQDPYRFGYSFVGWFAEGEAKSFDFSRSITHDLRLHAGFKPNEYTVEFDSAGGSAVASQTVAHGEHARKPADPLWEGHGFLGWFVDGSDEAFDFEGTPVLDDLTLHARWRKADDPSKPDEPDSQTHGVHTSIVNGQGAPVVSQRAESFDTVMGAMFAQEAANEDVYVTLSSRALNHGWLSDDAQRAFQAKLGVMGAQAGAWFDLSISKRVGSEKAEATGVHTTSKPVRLSVAVPESLSPTGGMRTFYLLRLHEGMVDVLAEGAGESLDFESDSFSTFLLAYVDKNVSPSASPGASPSNSPGATTSNSPSASQKQTAGGKSPVTNDPTANVTMLVVMGIALLAIGLSSRDRWMSKLQAFLTRR